MIDKFSSEEKSKTSKKYIFFESIFLIEIYMNDKEHLI